MLTFEHLLLWKEPDLLKARHLPWNMSVKGVMHFIDGTGGDLYVYGLYADFRDIRFEEQRTETLFYLQAPTPGYFSNVGLEGAQSL